MDHSENTEPFAAPDRQVIQELKDKAWFRLLKLYGPLFLALVWVYYKYLNRYPENPEGYHQMSRLDFTHVFEGFALVFGTIFLIFLVKDFRRMILPLNRELRLSKKNCIRFYARKYLDPVYKKCLIFYPGKEGVFIELDPDEFEFVQDGQQLYMETGSVTGEILLFKNDAREFKTADEFSFSDD